jgi:eukaryotic-like serine/threonine-protein kinase
VLGDSPDHKQYIETVPKLGYRFVAQVREIEPEESKSVLVRLQTQTGVQVEGKSSPEAGTEQRKPFLLTTRGLILDFAIAAMVIAVLGWGFHRLWFSGPKGQPVTPVVATRRAVAVLGFKNLAGNNTADWLSTALVEMLSTELSAGEQLRTVSGEDVARIKSELKIIDANTLSQDTLARVRKNVGADISVTGSYLELGDGPEGQIRLDIQVQDTTSGETIGSIAEVGTVSGLFQLVSKSGAKLRLRLGASAASSSEEEEIRAALPSTPEAARLYAQGLAQLRSFDAPEAQKLLAQALALDPNYALGHSALAAAWSALGYDEKARNEAQRAFDLSRGLARQERLVITGRYHEMNREWDKAVETYQTLYSLFPDNLEYGLRLADAQVSAGRGKDAQSTAAKLRKLPAPANEDPQIDLSEASAAESLGQFTDELKSAELAAQKGEALGESLLVARSLVKQAWALSRLGESEKAINTLVQARDLFRLAGDGQGVASTLRITSAVLSGEGEYAKATAAGQEALRAFERIGDKRGMGQTLNTLATIDYEQGNLEQAKQLFEKTLQIQRDAGSKINIAGALGNIANVLDEEGDLSGAQKLTEESIQVFTEVGDQRALGTALGNLANLLYERGDLPRARKTYEDALRIKRAIGYQRGIAYDLAGLSQVSEAENDLENAGKEQEEALAIRNKIGEKHNAAQSMLALAELKLEEGKPAEAEALAVQATEQLKNEKSPADEAYGEITLARCWLAEGKLSDAQKAVGRAMAGSRGSASRPLRFDLSIISASMVSAPMVSADVDVTGAKRPSRDTVSETEKRLQTSLAEAHRRGYVGYEFKLRLALGELKMKYGQPNAGRSDLEHLMQDAKAGGFALVARQAEDHNGSHDAPR